MKDASGYIMTPASDHLLFIFTPLLVLTVFAAAWLAGLGYEAAFVAATVGAAGHHLPGMMRAYADRELFSQYRYRFVLAPVVLIIVCSIAMYMQVAAVNAVMLVWGFWHGLAQLYGFARIYDRKVNSPASITGRADLTLLILWFGHGVIASDNRMAELAALFIDCGLPFPAHATLYLAAQSWLAVSVCYSLWYAFRALSLKKRGTPFSINKVLILTVSLAYWNVVMIAVPITIVSIALFELFHDVQYLAIVWSFNRNRKDQGALNQGFARSFYATGVAGLGLYLFAILFYGAFAMGQYWYPDTAVRNVAIVFFTVSTLLHFYYDGFIWKLRQPAISKTLNAGGGATQAGVTADAGHAFKWAALLLLIAGLVWLQKSDGRPALERTRLVRDAVPASFQANKNYATELKKAGKTTEAAEAFRRVLQINPADRQAQDDLLRLSTDVPFEFVD